MKNAIISALLFAGMVLPSGTVLAAMPNFVGTGYKTADKCTFPPDRPIWELVGTQIAITGCTPVADAERAEAEAYRVQNTGLKFATGSSVVLKSGATETCPFWFLPFEGCIIAPELVR